MTRYALPDHLHGIAYFVSAMLLFSIENVIIRDIAGELPFTQMVFLRNFISLLLFIPFILHYGLDQMKTQRFGRHCWRSIVGLLAMESWFYALSHLTVNVTTAISFTAPLFGTIFAVMFLGERIGARRIGALCIGFAGVLIITNPFDGAVWDPAMLAALFSAAMIAGVGVIIKTLTSTEPGWRIVCYMALLMTIISLPFAVPDWQTIDPDTLHAMFWIAATSTLAQLCMARAYRHASVVVLMPFDFTRLMFTALLAWMFLAETLTLPTIIGSGVIVGSTVFIAWQDRRRKRKAIAAQAGLT